MSFYQKINGKIKNWGKIYWFLREEYVVWVAFFCRFFDRPQPNVKKRILFYHIDSLNLGGTEKFIQILAKHINKEKYDVYFFYPQKEGVSSNSLERLDYVRSGGVTMVPFSFSGKRSTPPYVVWGMNPDIKKFIKTMNIDLLVTAGSGHADYPFSIIKRTPIILLNIFGQPNIQENISFHLCISEEVAKKLKPIVPDKKIEVFPVPSEGPSAEAVEAGKNLRKKFNIKDSDVVFGRIGRADDGIYDSIGIEAFKKATKVRDDLHYIIMSPPPILRQKVKDDGILNVHFLEPSSKEEDVWAFHASIDALAHFRLDGESFGLNIVEAMLSGKPIITHKTVIWNAHLEYLDESFSRVAEKDDVETYTKFMLEYAENKKDGKLEAMGAKAKEKAEALFLIKNNIGKFEKFIGKSF